MRSVFVCTAVLALSGCGMTASNTTISYAGSDAPTHEDRIAVIAKNSPNHGELEQQSWVSLVKDNLTSKGYTLAQNSKDFTVMAIVGLNVDSSKTENYSYSVPITGVTGYSGSSTTGTIDRSGNINASTTYYPRYGTVGYSNVSGDYTLYISRATIMFFRRTVDDKPKLLYTSDVFSASKCPVLASLAPMLVKRALERFPQTSRKTVTEVIEGGC